MAPVFTHLSRHRVGRKLAGLRGAPGWRGRCVGAIGSDLCAWIWPRHPAVGETEATGRWAGHAHGWSQQRGKELLVYIHMRQ